MYKLVFALFIITILFLVVNEDKEYFHGRIYGHRNMYAHRYVHRYPHYYDNHYKYRPSYGSIYRYDTMNYPFYYNFIPKWLYNPSRIEYNNVCDYKSCGGFCTPYNSKCCGGTNPSTCSRIYCKNSKLCE